ncbi:hypothetical protein JB92DRAFT_3128306 [Gautieria morchelliformis]|nr:hypothetical protein JB92DRAFT_3128306 [Gautieria morchelliformis]
MSSTDGGKSLAKKKLSELTEDEKILKSELQVIVRRVFKQLAGIKTTRKKSGAEEPLPGPPRTGADPRVDESGILLLTPLFTEDVSHAENCKVFDKVADMAVEEINTSPSDLLLQLYPTIPFKRVLLYEFAKTTFRGYVTKYQAQNDPVKKGMEAANRKVARHTCRREDKKTWRLTAVRKFMVNYGFNPAPLLHLDWMSKEDSEPEGYAQCEMETEKTQVLAEWRKNLLHRLGITGDLGLHDDMGLLEVVQPEWRSEYALAVLHELSRIHYMDLTATERKNIRYKRIKKKQAGLTQNLR